MPLSVINVDYKILGYALNNRMWEIHFLTFATLTKLYKMPANLWFYSYQPMLHFTQRTAICLQKQIIIAK